MALNYIGPAGSANKRYRPSLVLGKGDGPGMRFASRNLASHFKLDHLDLALETRPEDLLFNILNFSNKLLKLEDNSLLGQRRRNRNRTSPVNTNNTSGTIVYFSRKLHSNRTRANATLFSNAKQIHNMRTFRGLQT